MNRVLLAAVAAVLVAFTADATGQAPFDLLGRTTVDVTLKGGDRANGAFGGLMPASGEPHQVRTDLATAQPGRENRRRSLVYFAQLTDFQLSDEESPARVEFLDSSADSPLNSPFGSAHRPQEALVAHMTEEAVRQVNAFADASPVAQAGGARAKMGFALTTGDSADNQQRNETEAVVDLLEGNQVDPNGGSADPADYDGICAAVAPETAPKYTGVQDYGDGLGSGSFYDPNQPLGQYAQFPAYPGLMDRAQQPFKATGLKVPSYVTFGNHDGLVQGNQAANPGLDRVATGCVKPFTPMPSLDPADTPDEAAALLASGGAGLVPPDPERAFVSKPQYKDLHKSGMDGHGFAFVDPAEAAASKGAAGYYAWSPAPGFRFIALDTISEGGVAGPSANGNLDDPQFRWVTGQIAAAAARRELVVLFGHHPPRSLTSTVSDETAGSCSDERAGCDLDPRPSTPLHDGTDLENLLKASPNVIALVSGHTHENRVTPVTRPGGGGFWEIETAAEIDFPHQNRLIEVMDNGDGTLSIFGTVLDHAGPVQAPAPGTDASAMTVAQLASVGRLIGFNDPQSPPPNATDNGGGSGKRSDRNVELLLGDPRSRTIITGDPQAPPRPPGSCRDTSGLRSVGLTPRRRGAVLRFTRAQRRPVSVDVFRHSQGRRVLGERLVARFERRSRSVTWSGRANRRGRRAGDGLYTVRFTMGTESRRLVVQRRNGRFRVRPRGELRRACDLLAFAKVERPAFGGPTNRALNVSYFTTAEARVRVRILRGTRVVKRFPERRVRAGALVRVRVPAEKLRRGDHRVVVEARAGSTTRTATLVARRI